uniref:Uncharacterized protein n=1 Tax=Urocitellus parryii TaxID=9999 RepID=A0A8D2GPQ8_UROPR
MVTQGCSYYHIMIFSAMFGTCSQYSKQNFFSFAMLVVVEEISLDKNDLGKHWKGRCWTVDTRPRGKKKMSVLAVQCVQACGVLKKSA